MKASKLTKKEDKQRRKLEKLLAEADRRAAQFFDWLWRDELARSTYRVYSLYRVRLFDPGTDPLEWCAEHPQECAELLALTEQARGKQELVPVELVPVACAQKLEQARAERAALVEWAKKAA